MELTVIFIILCTGFGCNCKTGRNRKAQKTHFCKVGTFTTKKILHIGFTVRSFLSKGVNSFYF